MLYIFESSRKCTGNIRSRNNRFSSQAKFLIAYYHYLLLRLYGPIVLIDREIPLDATGELAFPKRRPYDECVEWIADRLDEVAPLLPPIQTSDKYGAPRGLRQKE